MADVSTVAPIYQLVGTGLTVAGGIVVAVIARGPSKRRKVAPTDGVELKGIHTDIILLTEAVSGLKILLLDHWQWARDRETAARERHEWLKENIREKE